mgnify:CR=1 FL=1
MTETSAKILCDSVSPAGHRLTTFEAMYPRIVLAEVNTHRLLSRNSASSRAIPVEKMVKRVLEDPYVPTHWGKNQKGMAAEQDVDEGTAAVARRHWLMGSGMMRSVVEELLKLGIHKQITNRLLEPFQWHPTIITATEWSNFFNLRDHKAAHPDFRDLAHAMRELYGKSSPVKLDYGQWHLPLIDEETREAFSDADQAALPLCDLPKVSVGRCARVSTLTHEGKRDLQADIDLCDKMMAAGHASPYEHVARPMTADELELFKQKKMRWDPKSQNWHWVGAHYEERNHHWWDGEYTHFLGNIQGWAQYRKLIPYEEDILGEHP